MLKHPVRPTTTTRLHQSSESSLVHWPALKNEGKCVKSLAEQLLSPDTIFDVTECA